MSDRERERLDIALALVSWGRRRELRNIAQWVEDDAVFADDAVREYSARVAARLRELAGEASRRPDADLVDEIADMIVDWYGRAVLEEADRDLAHQIILRVLGEDTLAEHREPTYGWHTDERA